MSRFKEKIKPHSQWCKELTFDGSLFDFIHLGHLVTAVFGLVEKDGLFLLVYNPKKRRWCIPGGHISLDESRQHWFHRCLEREMLEEANLFNLDSSLFCFARVENEHERHNPEWNSPYPFPFSYMLFYQISNFEEKNEPLSHEIEEKAWFSLEDACKRLGETDSLLLRLFSQFKK